MRGPRPTRVCIVPLWKQERWHPWRWGRAVWGPEESGSVVSGTGGGGLGNMARALCNHPDVHMAHCLLYKLYAKSTATSMGSKKTLKLNSQ